MACYEQSRVARLLVLHQCKCLAMRDYVMSTGEIKCMDIYIISDLFQWLQYRYLNLVTA